MRWLPCLIALALTLVARPAGADDAVALAKAAEKLAGAGDYTGAAAKFRAAFALDPRPEFLCNVGVAYHRAKVLPKAKLYLDECLRRGSKFDAKFVAQVRTALTAVEDKLRAGEFAAVDIVVEPAGASVSITTFFDPDEQFVGSRVVWMPFGKYTVAVSADGYAAASREVVIDSKVQRDLRVALVRATPSVKVVPEPVPPTPTPATPGRSLKPPLLASALTIVVAATAGVFYLQARGNMDDAASTTISQDEYDELVDSARSKQKLSWVFAGLAGAGAVVSGYLWYRATRSPARVEVQPTAGGAVVGVGLHW